MLWVPSITTEYYQLVLSLNMCTICIIKKCVILGVMKVGASEASTRTHRRINPSLSAICCSKKRAPSSPPPS
ncbi:hypothetical protein L1887_00849 [Cichorium endivia]|nr:hypothetical protein L1887_00849 [Cichorium endivia]